MLVTLGDILRANPVVKWNDDKVFNITFKIAEHTMVFRFKLMSLHGFAMDVTTLLQQLPDLAKYSEDNLEIVCNDIGNGLFNLVRDQLEITSLVALLCHGIEHKTIDLETIFVSTMKIRVLTEIYATHDEMASWRNFTNLCEAYAYQL